MGLKIYINKTTSLRHVIFRICWTSIKIFQHFKKITIFKNPYNVLPFNTKNHENERRRVNVTVVTVNATCC